MFHRSDRSRAIPSPHARDHDHPSAERVSISPSILRLSARDRLAAVAVVIVAIWAAVYWAMS